MKIKAINKDGTVTYENGMVGTRDLPDFIRGFKDRIVKHSQKTGNALARVTPSQESVRQSWRSQLAATYGLILVMKQARRVPA